MEDFIDRLSMTASLERPAARRATQAILKIAKQHLSEPLATDLFHALPGAFALAGEASQHQTPSSGIEEMMFSAMKNVLGVEDPFVTLISGLKAEGLTSAQALLTGQAFLEFAHEKAGPLVMERITNEIPGLRRLN